MVEVCVYIGNQRKINKLNIASIRKPVLIAIFELLHKFVEIVGNYLNTENVFTQRSGVISV